MATTAGLTLATISAKSGSSTVSPCVEGGAQSGSMGVVVEVGGVSVEGGAQLMVPMVPKRRHRIMIRPVGRYFIFIAFIANSIVARRVEFGQKAFVAFSRPTHPQKLCLSNSFVPLPTEGKVKRGNTSIGWVGVGNKTTENRGVNNHMNGYACFALEAKSDTLVQFDFWCWRKLSSELEADVGAGGKAAWGKNGGGYG